MNKRKTADTSDILDDNCIVIKTKKAKMGIVPNKDFINYIAVPSLESMVIRSIVANLWKHADFRKEIMEHLSKFCNTVCSISKDERDKSLVQIMKNISKKLYHLSLPNILKEKAKNVISLMGLEIVNWIATFGTRYDHSEILDTLCLNMNGTIDKAKAYEFYLDKNNFHHLLKPNVLLEEPHSSFFNGVCECCLEDHIANLWRQTPKEVQENCFYSELVYQTYDGHLIAYWVCFAQNELTKLMRMIIASDVRNLYSCNHSIYKNMFTLSVLKGKILAVKYFWKKLTDEEKNENLAFWTCLVIEERIGAYECKNEYTDVMCFLLSQINDKAQQIEVFQEHTVGVLRLLFCSYPLRQYLLPTIQLMWDFLDSYVYNDILLRVVEEINQTGLDGKYFSQLWCNSPMKFKTHFIQYIINSCRGPVDNLWNLFDIGDIETIKLVFQDANVKEKKQFIFSSTKSGIFFKLIYTEKLYLFQILIEESGMSESEVKTVHEDILQLFGHSVCCFWIRDDNWQAVENFLHWGFSFQYQIEGFKAEIVSGIERTRSLGPLGYAKWSSFEKFLNWCFKSDEEINNFKMILSPFETMVTCIFDIIVFGYNFEFADKLLAWSFQPGNKISQFKKDLMLSDKGIDMFIRFVSNYRVYDSEYSQMELVEKLTKWFHPYEKDVLIKFKDDFKDTFFHFNGRYANTDVLDSFFYLLDSFVHGC